MKKCEVWLAIGAATPIFLLVLWMLLDNACTLSTSLGDGESVGQCYSRWVSAWSGWAAATGALAAAIWAYSGVQQQLKHQTLQKEAERLDDTISNLHARIATLETLRQNVEGAVSSLKAIGSLNEDDFKKKFDEIVFTYNTLFRPILDTLAAENKASDAYGQLCITAQNACHNAFGSLKPGDVLACKRQAQAEIGILEKCISTANNGIAVYAENLSNNTADRATIEKKLKRIASP